VKGPPNPKKQTRACFYPDEFLLDEVILVTEAEIEEAMRHFLREERLVVEGSGAVGAAALLAGKVDLAKTGAPRPRVVNVVTGRNASEAVLQRVLPRPEG